MKKILLVLKNEFRMVVMRRSFILTLFLLPLIGFILLQVVNVLNKNTDSSGTSALENIFLPSSSKLMEGYVDLSGTIKVLPNTAVGKLKAFDSEAEAKHALTSNQISAYYLIPPDYIQTGNVYAIRPDFNPMSGFTASSTITDTLTYNLVSGDEVLAYRIVDPLNSETVFLSDVPVREPGSFLTFFLPYAVTMLFYILILTTSSLLLSSVTKEKENRTIELLMTSITPTQMLTGKIIALGLAGLLQTIVWTVSSWLLLKMSGGMFDLGISFQLPFSVVFWGILFFIFGYALYGSLMAGLGALVPNLREASQATTVIILPMIVPLMLINVLIDDPNGTLSMIMGFFPLTSPVVMMTRISATPVPFWQPLVALVLLAGTVVLVVRSVANMFRAQTLLSGKPFGVKVFFKALIGKA